MSAHIEWLAASETSVQVFTPGEDWVGAGEHRRPVLTLAQDDVIAIEGTPAELRALAARITAVATAASARLDPDASPVTTASVARPATLGAARGRRPLAAGPHARGHAVPEPADAARAGQPAG